jgi:tyrosinase
MDGGDYGHVTWTNMPESKKAVSSNPINMGYAAESTTIGAVMDPIGGPFCYFHL